MARKLLMSILFTVLISTMSFAQGPRAQAMHGMADPAINPADVYVTLFGSVIFELQDVMFRQVGENFQSPIGGITIGIGVALGNSTGVDDTLVSFPIPLENGRNYIGVARGVIDPAMFAPNPDGIFTGLDFSLTNEARLQSGTSGSVEMNLVHLVTDAPTVDFTVSGGGQLYDNVRYGDITPYTAISPGVHVLEMRDASGTNILGLYQVDLSNYADSTVFIMMSGFNDPANNQNGEPITLQGVLPSDQIIPFLDVTTGIGDDPQSGLIKSAQLYQNYPNPFNPSTNIEYAISNGGFVELVIYDILGKKVRTLVSESRQPGSHTVNWNGLDDAGNPAVSGVYFYQLQTSSIVEMKKMLLVR